MNVNYMLICAGHVAQWTDIYSFIFRHDIIDVARKLNPV